MVAPPSVMPAQKTLIQNFFNADVDVVRLDLLDQYGSGNKTFKLKYNLDQARKAGCRRLISFGGAYSNHIHALAVIGRQQGFGTVGLIRGEACSPLNATLQDAVDAGMQIQYLSRQDYRRRSDPVFLQQLAEHYPDCYWIPEGGSNLLGVRGCMEIARYVDTRSELLVLPCATAATMAGLIAGCPQQRVLGISVLKNAFDLSARVESYLQALVAAGDLREVPRNWSVEHDFHCGGYAKVDKALADFLARFERQTSIPAEPIYSGKMFYAIEQMLRAGTLAASARITAIHTGGMQGLRGMRLPLQRQQATEPC